MKNIDWNGVILLTGVIAICAILFYLAMLLDTAHLKNWYPVDTINVFCETKQILVGDECIFIVYEDSTEILALKPTRELFWSHKSINNFLESQLFKDQKNLDICIKKENRIVIYPKIRRIK